MDLKYHTDLTSALTNLFHVHLYDPPADFFNKPITLKNVFQKLDSLKPTQIEVINYFKGKLNSTLTDVHDPLLPFPIKVLVKQGKVFLIKTIEPAQKCEYCGIFYKAAHNCNVRRRDFYFHTINYKTSGWWENISFRPIGSPPSTERLFITYDIETYTWHGRYGKQLIPYLLVFNLSGEGPLIELADSLARSQHWDRWNNAPHTFFILNPHKREVGKKFKIFRDSLQREVTQLIWSQLVRTNPCIFEFKEQNGLETVDDITYEQLKTLKLMGQPRFIEIYVVGHNISGFDEIVLAAQVVSNKADMIPAFKITRNFMPRAGKILFNDITFGLPNPLYQKRTQFAEWQQGCTEVSDMANQYVKLMVRDTLALTHTSLRNAAVAYALPVEKGSCPYEAVNSFYRLGSYRQDEDGFPDLSYWKDEDEYLANKELWKKENRDAYDIIQHALDYCAQDVLVTAELVKKLQSSYQHFVASEVNLPDSSFNIFQKPTISSNSHAIFKQILYRAEKMQQNSLGDVLLAPSNEMYEYVRQSIRGGRCYPTYIGVLEEPIYVYDICGMYASALTHPFPAGRPLNPLDRALAVQKWEEKLATKGMVMDYFDSELLPGIFTIDADPPDEDFLDVLPPFCSRRGGRLCWTNEMLRGEVATSVDLITLHNRGWEVRIISDERTTVFPEWKCIAKEYVQLNIAAKEKADRDKNQTIRSIAKLLSNALYGSFATKLDNKKIVFSDQMDSEITKGISTGTYSVKSSSFIETDNLSAEVMPEFVVAYPPVPEAEQEPSDDDDNSSASFIPMQGHVSYTYKPITFMDVEDDDVCLHTLEKTTPLVENNRYPSQLASFVLAWARAFISEWSEFLYSEDRGIPESQRRIKSVYGDTDSLFMTEAGHKLMQTKGKHRIKKNGGKLVFDPENPQVTWLVECETQCSKCGHDAYSPESVFLAPKLYALKSILCPACGYEGKGKLRAKGHATSELSYDTLKECYLADEQRGNAHYQTTRMSLKRTLATNQSNAAPFTVTETTLTRTVRPWKDMTLRPLDLHRLSPYSNSHPNPRNTEVCMMTLPWDT